MINLNPQSTVSRDMGELVLNKKLIRYSEILNIINMKNGTLFSHRILVSLFISVFFLSLSVKVSGADRYAVASGNWNATSTWSSTSGGSSGASIPVAGDVVYIGEGAVDRTVTIPAGYAAACTDLYMGNLADNTAAVLTFSAATSTLAVSGNVQMNRPNAGATSNLNVGAGTMTVDGNVTLAYHTVSATNNNRITQISISTGTVTVTGDVSLNAEDGGGLQAKILFSDAGTINIGGSFTLNAYGFVSGSTGTFNFNGTSAQTIPFPSITNFYYYNITTNNISTSGATIGAVVTTTYFKGNLTVQSGKLNNGGYAITGVSTRTLSVANGATLQLAGTTSSFPSGFGTTTLGATSTVVYEGSDAQTVADIASPGYGNLTLAGSNTKTAAAGLDIRGDVLISSTFAAGTYTHNVAGEFTNDGTFTAGTSTVVFNGNTQILGGTTSATFNNLTISSTGSTTLGVNTSVAGNLNISSGAIFDLGTYTCNRTASGGTITVAGTMKLGGNTGGQTGSNFPSNFSTRTMTGGTVVYYYNGNQTVFNSPSYNHVTLSGSGDKVFSAATTINGILNINSGSKADLGSGFSHTCGWLVLADQSQVSGSWGSTGSSATNKNDTYFLSTSSGIITVSANIFFSTGSNAPNTLANWKSARNGTGSSPTNFTTGQMFVIQNGHTLTTSSTWSVSGTNSRIIIESGGTLVASSAITLASGTTFQVDNGGLYKHQNTGAWATTIFQGTEVFGNSSTVEINQTATTLPTNSTYGNLTINLTSDPTANLSFGGNLTTINGNLTIQNTQSREVRISASTSPNVTIAGYLSISGTTSSFTLTSGTGSPIVTIGSYFSMTGGTFSMSGGAGIGTLNVPGNFTHSGGTITETSTGRGEIVFTGTTAQTYTSGGTVSNTINYTVKSGAILQMAAVGTTVSGAGTFTLSSGGTLGITSADGISTVGTATGNIRTTTGRSYSPEATYIYNGGGAQNTGTGFPTDLTGILKIDDAGYTVTLNNSRTIANAGTVEIVNGTFAAGTNLTMSTTSGIIRSGGTMTGTLQGTGVYDVSYTGNSMNTSSELSGSGLNDVTINLTSGQTLTLDQNRVPDGNVSLSGGTFNLGTYTINRSVSGGIITVSNGTTLKIGGTNGFPSNYSTHTLGSTGTVEYDGSTQTVSNETYGHLAISNSGVKTLSGAATVSGNLNVTTGPLTIGTAGELTVSGTTTLTGSQSLVISSTSSGTGSFIDNGISGSGTAKVQRYITKYNAIGDKMFHFLSSPVTSQAISPSFSNPPANTTDDFYKFDEPSYTWINFRDGAGTGVNPSFGESDFVVGRGYLVAYNVNSTKEFIGTLNSGTLTTGSGLSGISYTASGGGGWNLVGNPYASAIDWDNVSSGQRTNVNNAVYVYDNVGQYYLTWVNGVGGLTNGIIPPMQGFMVKASASSPALTLENADRVHSGALFYKEEPTVDNVLSLKVDGNDRSDVTFVRFQDETTATFDGEWDAYKLMGGSNVPNLYTTVGEDDYSVNSIPFSSRNTPLALNLKVGVGGNHTLTASTLESFPAGAVITLKDLQNNYTQDLMTNPVYSFVANPSDAAERFLLFFSGTIGIGDTPGMTADPVRIYGIGSTVHVNGLDIAGNGHIYVYSLLGQQLQDRNYSNTNTATIDLSGNTGYYIVKVVTGEGTHTAKIFIR